MEQQAEGGVDGVVHHEVSGGLLVQVNQGQGRPLTAAHQEPALVGGGGGGGGEGGQAGQQSGGEVVNQQSRQARADLRPDQLPLLQEQGGRHAGELQAGAVDERLDSEEGLGLQREVLYAAPHVQHTGVLQLERGQVAGVEMPHSLAQNLSAALVVLQDVVETSGEEREHLVSLVQDAQENLVADLLWSVLHHLPLLPRPPHAGHAHCEAEEELGLHRPPDRPRLLRVKRMS